MEGAQDRHCNTMHSYLDVRVSTRFVSLLFGFICVHGIVCGVIPLSLQTLDPGLHSRLQSHSQTLLHLKCKPGSSG